LNHRPADYESAALPTELRRPGLRAQARTERRAKAGKDGV